mgnify:CR=1 FL=1
MLPPTASKTHALNATISFAVCFCTAALGRMLLAVSMMSAQLKSETDSITATIAGGGPAGNITVVGHMGGIVKGCITNPEVELPLNEFGKLDVSGAVGGIAFVEIDGSAVKYQLQPGQQIIVDTGYVVMMSATCSH